MTPVEITSRYTYDKKLRFENEAFAFEPPVMREPSLRNVLRKTFHVGRYTRKTVGGCSLRSKRHRTAVRGETLNLATDFVPKDRGWWDESGLVVPACKIFIWRYRLEPGRNS